MDNTAGQIVTKRGELEAAVAEAALANVVIGSQVRPVADVFGCRSQDQLLERAGDELRKAWRGPGRPVLEEKRKRGRKMKRRRHKPRARGAGVTTVVVLRLYVAGGAPNSVQAIANLEAICREYLKDGHRLEVVDVLEHPQRAMAEGVLVTPSLAKLSPRPISNIVGNLSDRAKVLLALGLKRKLQ